MAQVHAGDVDARLDDGAERLVAGCRGPEGRDDLGSSHGGGGDPSMGGGGRNDGSS